MSTPEEIEGRVRAALDELGIAGWEWIEIDPQYGDTADFCEQYGYDLPIPPIRSSWPASEGQRCTARGSCGRATGWM